MQTEKGPVKVTFNFEYRIRLFTITFKPLYFFLILFSLFHKKQLLSKLLQ